MSAPRLVFLLPDVAMPPDLEAVVYEQDTELILRQDLEVRDAPQTAAELAREAIVARGFKPGSVVVRETKPLQLFAIVHDLGAEPTWQAGWIDAALAAILGVVAERRLARLALPLLGTVHGRLGVARAAELLAGRLATPPPSLREVWLMVPRQPVPVVARKLAPVLQVAG